MCCVAVCERKALRRTMASRPQLTSAGGGREGIGPGGGRDKRKVSAKGKERVKVNSTTEGKKSSQKKQSRTRRKRPQVLLTIFSQKRITRKRALVQFIPSQGRVHSFVRIAVQQTRIINYAGGGVGVAPAPPSGYVCQLPQEVHNLP